MKCMLTLLFILLTFFSINAIEVSGIQSGNWTPANNPYQIIGDISVLVDNVLVLEPGVIVEAMGNFQITAQGSIIAIGNEQDSIKFISGQANQTLLWKGIRLENTSVQSQFQYCLIELGQYGINSINSPASITYCHFKKNQKGIQAYGIGSIEPAEVQINHNLIELSQQSGIYVIENTHALIQDNDIRFNGTGTAYYGAIQLSNQSSGGSCSPEIANNHIHHNYKQGITASDIAYTNAIQPDIHDNLIENNLTGIYLRHASGYTHHNTIINNFIAGNMNSGAGIMVSGNTAHPYFEDNIITGNYTGFYLTENSNPIIGDASSDNMWAQGGNTIRNNIDANNVRHTIACYQYTTATFTVKAENNTWDYTNAAQIAETITDFNDNPAFPTIDFDPWVGMNIPIYLAGTITCNNTAIDSAYVQLVSVQTGLIINIWQLAVNTPFSVPVYHDSLVYIIIRAESDAFEQFYGAYGGIDNPTPTQIIADVQFHIGDVALTNTAPNWWIQKVGTPLMISGYMSYPISISPFVYEPYRRDWVYRDGDFLKVSRISIMNFPEGFIHYSTPTHPIFRIISNFDSHDSWQQMVAFRTLPPAPIMGNASSTAGITYFTEGTAFSYDRVDITHDQYKMVQVFDHNSNNWFTFVLDNASFQVDNVIREVPVLTEPDGTLLPLQTGNTWKLIYTQAYTVPTYFGYKVADSLSFYWIPPRAGMNYVSYRLYNNSVQIAELPLTAHSYTIPIPYDGMEHTYTISAWDGTNNNYAITPIVLSFTHEEDDFITPQALSIYPNPFNPAKTTLTAKFDNAKATSQDIRIYNLKGQLVWKSDISKDATELKWNGRDNNGHICASGLYQIQLTDNKGQQTHRKLMLIH